MRSAVWGFEKSDKYAVSVQGQSYADCDRQNILRSTEFLEALSESAALIRTHCDLASSFTKALHSVPVQKYPIVNICEDESNCFQCIRKFRSESNFISPLSSSDHHIDLSSSSDHEEDPVIASKEQDGFICAECHRSFESNTTLIRHIKSHKLEQKTLSGVEEVITETPCDTKKAAQITTRNTSNSVGNAVNLFCCALCPDKKFLYKIDLLMHVNMHEPESEWKKCPECKEEFSDRSELWNHIATHTHEVFYTCSLCPSTRATKSLLEQHLRGHNKRDESMIAKLIDNARVPYSCIICGAQCNFKVDILIHLKCHQVGSDQLKNVCPLCEKNFRSLYCLRTHMAKHTREEFWKCEICPYTCTERKELNLHSLQHRHLITEKSDENKFCCETGNVYLVRNTENLFSCDACSKKFEFKVDLILHLNYGGLRPRKMICPDCGKRSKRLCKLREHLTAHTGEKFLRCNHKYCLYTSNLKRSLKKHIVDCHKEIMEALCSKCGEEITGTCYTVSKLKKSHCTSTKYNISELQTNICPAKCGFCKAEFVQKSFLDDHIRVRHGTQCCPVCLCAFSSRRKMRRHFQRKHSPKEKYICAHCDAVFKGRKESIELHLRKHGFGLEKMTCKICKKKIFQSSWSSHNTTCHLQKKEYVCEKCGAAFARSDYLQKHMFKHNNKRPYLCCYCGAKFSRADNLKAHERKHALQGSQMKLKPAIWKRMMVDVTS